MCVPHSEVGSSHWVEVKPGDARGEQGQTRHLLSSTVNSVFSPVHLLLLTVDGARITPAHAHARLSIRRESKVGVCSSILLGPSTSGPGLCTVSVSHQRPL